MLFNLHLLFQDPRLFLLVAGGTILALLVAITVHEFSHAWLATNLGDPTAKSLGRLTLNPLAHLDPTGTVMLLLVGFGWGKPVPVNPLHLRNGGKAGMAVVALAGPLSNLITAAVVSIPIRFGTTPWHSPYRYVPFSQSSVSWILADLMGLIIVYNLILGIFNLIPIAPLDGFKVVLGILPRTMAASFSRLEPYGPVILLVIIGIGYVTGQSILGQLLNPAVGFMTRMLTGRSL